MERMDSIFKIVIPLQQKFTEKEILKCPKDDAI